MTYTDYLDTLGDDDGMVAAQDALNGAVGLLYAVATLCALAVAVVVVLCWLPH